MSGAWATPCRSIGPILPDLALQLGLKEDVLVTAGIHDSNASLLPYLASKAAGDFILNSTGTWCVLMHPDPGTQAAAYRADDIGKVVFFNRSALDRPVKTAIFLGGMENDAYVKLWQEAGGKEGYPESDMETLRQLLTERNAFLLPELVSGSGQFPRSRPGIYEDGIFYSMEDMQKGKKLPRLLSDSRRFQAALVLSLVIQTETALLRAGLQPGTAVFTEGGFRKNSLYNRLLASILPENDFYLTDISEATAAGAALCGLMSLTGRPLEDFGSYVAIKRTKIEPEQVSGYREYKEAWLQKAANAKEQ